MADNLRAIVAAAGAILSEEGRVRPQREARDASQQVEDWQQAWAERDIRLAWVVMPLGLTLVVLLVRVFFDADGSKNVTWLETCACAGGAATDGHVFDCHYQ